MSYVNTVFKLHTDAVLFQDERTELVHIRINYQVIGCLVGFSLYCTLLVGTTESDSISEYSTQFLLLIVPKVFISGRLTWP